VVSLTNKGTLFPSQISNNLSQSAQLVFTNTDHYTLIAS